jgi:hypothetical protein
VIEVSAAAVVVGATEVIGPPVIEARPGASLARSWSWYQPRPSTTISTS